MVNVILVFFLSNENTEMIPRIYIICQNLSKDYDLLEIEVQKVREKYTGDGTYYVVSKPTNAVMKTFQFFLSLVL